MNNNKIFFIFFLKSSCSVNVLLYRFNIISKVYLLTTTLWPVHKSLVSRMVNIQSYYSSENRSSILTRVKESARRIKYNNRSYYYTDNNNTIKCRQQAREFERIEQYVVHTKPSVLDSSTGMYSGLVAGVGLVWHLLLYYWLIQDCKVNYHIVG